MSGFWTPDKRWEGLDVVIVGGGPSLQGFDWSLLNQSCVLGCNEAFRLGADIVNAVMFSDSRWFKERAELLDQYVAEGGSVFTHWEGGNDFKVREKYPWLKVMKRFPRGLRKDGLGFGYSSGAGAINLALLLGAKRVYLLGFDCKVDPNKGKNWHNYYGGFNRPNYNPPFRRFELGMKHVAHDLPVVFPDREVINLGPDSDLKHFPKAFYKEVLSHA